MFMNSGNTMGSKPTSMFSGAQGMGQNPMGLKNNSLNSGGIFSQASNQRQGGIFGNTSMGGSKS